MLRRAWVWSASCAAGCLLATPAFAQEVVSIPGDHATMAGAFGAVQTDGMIIELSADPTDLTTTPCLDVNVDVTIRSAEGLGPFTIQSLYTQRESDDEEIADLTLERVNIQGDGRSCGAGYPQVGASDVWMPTLLKLEEGSHTLIDVTLQEGFTGVGVGVFDAEVTATRLTASGFTSGSPFNLVSEDDDASAVLWEPQLTGNDITAVNAVDFSDGSTQVTLEVHSGHFEDNRDPLFVRAVDLYLVGLDQALVQDTEFLSDGSDDGDGRLGGAIYAEDTALTVTRGSFTGYFADEGGAIYARSPLGVGSLTLDSGGGWYGDVTHFEDCSTPPRTGKGGAIRTSGVPVTIKGAAAVGGVAGGGAFLYAEDAAYVSGRYLALSEHEVSSIGGVVHVVNTPSVELQGVHICDVDVSTPETGVALSMIGVSDRAFIYNSVIDRVEVELYPLISITGSAAVLRNNTFHDNLAESVVWFSGRNLSFWNNIHSDSLGTAPVSPLSAISGDLRSEYNLFSPSADAWFNSYAVDGEGTLRDVDPALVDAYVNDVDCAKLPLLLPLSPAIDAGDPTVTEPDDGSRSDIGAFGGEDRAFPDQDGDGHDALTDCDDDDPTTYPGAIDDTVDARDQNCDGVDGLPDDAEDAGNTAVGLTGGCACGAGLEGRGSFMVIWGLLITVLTRRKRCSHPC